MNATEMIKKLAALNPATELEGIVLCKDERKTVVICDVTRETSKEMQGFLKHFAAPSDYPAGMLGTASPKDKRANPDADAIDVEGEEVEDAAE